VQHFDDSGLCLGGPDASALTARSAATTSKRVYSIHRWLRGTAILTGRTILVVEEQPLIALDLRTTLEEAGAEVLAARDAADVVARINATKLSAAVVDWRPDSDHHRRIARALKRAGVPFLFYATDSIEEVTTVRGAPIFLKPARPEVIVKALALMASM
jgi:CheY-like chemotaxis protein